VLEDLRVSISASAAGGGPLFWEGERHLFEKTWAKGAGELGESVYGLKDDFKPVVGEGMSWVAVAMAPSPSVQIHRRYCASLGGASSVVGGGG
jgi:hypothetical protein